MVGGGGGGGGASYDWLTAGEREWHQGTRDESKERRRGRLPK